MAYKNKRFDKGLSDTYDPLAKKYTTKLFEQLGFELVGKETNNAGAFDLIFKNKKQETCTVEAEIKVNKPLKFGTQYGEKIPFLYDTYDIAGRKEKSKADFIVAFDETGNYCCVISKKVFQENLKLPRKVKHTKFTYNEQFISIPTEQCSWFQLKENRYDLTHANKKSKVLSQ